VSPSAKDETFSDERWLRIQWDPEHRILGRIEMAAFATRTFTTVSEATEWASGT